MSRYELWSLVVTAIAAIGGLFVFWPKRAKLRFVRFEKCLVNSFGFLDFDLLIDNSGSKDCSLIRVKLIWPNGSNANLSPDKSTPLPKVIPAGLTERVIMHGDSHKSSFEPNAIDGEVTLEFNTHKPIKKTIRFGAGCRGSNLPNEKSEQEKDKTPKVVKEIAQKALEINSADEKQNDIERFCKLIMPSKKRRKENDNL
jgi:hypothetical protein